VLQIFIALKNASPSLVKFQITKYYRKSLNLGCFLLAVLCHGLDSLHLEFLNSKHCISLHAFIVTWYTYFVWFTRPELRFISSRCELSDARIGQTKSFNYLCWLFYVSVLAAKVWSRQTRRMGKDFIMVNFMISPNSL
jgi:hypothetical protein